jgi:hypothetical protein
MKVYKYLEEIGLSEKDLPQNYDVTDKERRDKHKKQRKIYGFDTREIWDLDYTFALFFYQRLKMFDEYTSSDKSYHTFEYNGKP